MKNLFFLFIILFSISCSSQTNYSSPDEFHKRLYMIDNSNYPTYSKFIKEATLVILCINKDPDCNIDFDKMTKLLDSAFNANNRVLSQLSTIGEFDKKISYKNSMENYWTSSYSVLEEFKIWLDTLQVTREKPVIDKINDELYTRLNTMKEKLKIYEDTREYFIKEYKTCDYKKYYYPNGKLKEEGCEMANKKEGLWNEYSEDGYLSFEWTYKNGLKSGTYKAFFENGKIRATGKYLKDQLIDTVKVYDDKGLLVSETVWATKKTGGSEMISKKIYNEDAKPDGTIEEIDGIKYIWLMGEKLQIESISTSSTPEEPANDNKKRKNTK